MTDPFRARSWMLAHGRSLVLGPKGLVMAVINVTPDSFSDGGQFGGPDEAVTAALKAVSDGAAIIDIGGESTRPGAEPVSAAEEQDRVLPVIEALAGAFPAGQGPILSIDTYRPETARLAIAAGAHAVNDITGLQGDVAMAGVVAAAGAGVIIMHTGRNRARLDDVIADQRMFFDLSLGIAEAAGVDRGAIMLDPGFGFAKETPGENFELMARLPALFDYDLPILAGTSRKRFLGAATGRQAGERDVATAATTAMLRMMGAAVFRVHNVAFNMDALGVADAMLDAGRTAKERKPAA